MNYEGISCSQCQSWSDSYILLHTFPQSSSTFFLLLIHTHTYICYIGQFLSGISLDFKDNIAALYSSVFCFLNPQFFLKSYLFFTFPSLHLCNSSAFFLWTYPNLAVITLPLLTFWVITKLQAVSSGRAFSGCLGDLWSFWCL
jgi:hypothetical protein